MRGIPVVTGGGIPDAPTIGTATAGNAQATVTFTPPAYIGKGTVTYEVTSTPAGLNGTGTASPIVLGATNGVSYTFTVRAVTNYGVSSLPSAASNSVTPAAPPSPPPGPPPPPPPPPCSCAPNPPAGCGFVGYTCDGQMRYDYYDCGCSQTCPGTGGYNGQYVVGFCGYTGPISCGSCGDGGCTSVRCGPENYRYVCYDGCGNECSSTECFGIF